MTSLDPRICLKLKEARREAKLSQSVVAIEVGCKQSALSMFEQGDGTKLSEEVIVKLAKKFNVSLESEEKREVTPAQMPAYVPPPVQRVIGFCPNPHCPTNKPFEVDGRTLYLPDRKMADPVGGKFCAYCGELLERKCPNCGAPVHDGAICSLCGDPFVVSI